MQKTKKKAGRLVAMFAAAAMAVSSMSMTAMAAGHEDLAPGTYDVDASLSCYISAMGGIEFGAPLLTGATVTVNEDNSADMTLNLTKSSVTIYGVVADTFVDPNFPLGYHDGAAWQDATYTLSDDTALDSNGEAVNYVDSMTFRLPSASDVYNLAVYVNSNTMGVQFGGEDARYNSTLTVDWTSARAVKNPDETSQRSSNVSYTVEGGYEVRIPAEIIVDSATNKGEYNVEAVNFTIAQEAYVAVTAAGKGSLFNGQSELAFANALEDEVLKVTGDSLQGEVSVNETAPTPGKYTGTLDFDISYYAA